MDKDKISELICRGQITREHELSPDNSQWRAAGEFAEFFGTGPREGAQICTNDPSSVTPQQSVNDASELNLMHNERTTEEDANAEWHAHFDDKNHGPIAERQMRQWVASGRVTPDTLVWKADLSDWIEAREVVPEWFSASILAANSANMLDTPTDVSAIFQEMHRYRGWVYFLSIVALLASSISVAWIVVLLVVLVTSPISSTGVTIAGVFVLLINLTLSVVGGFAFLNLLQYANAVSVLKHAPSLEHALKATKKLGKVWLFAGIQTASAIVFVLVILLLTFLASIQVPFFPAG